MSMIIDKLNDLTKGAPGPLGFRAGRHAEERTHMLLVASYAQVPGSESTGADAAVFYTTRTGPGTSFFGKVSKVMEGRPWGCWTPDTSAKTVTRLAENGCDFIVFPADSPVFSADSEGKPGRILQLEPNLSDGTLRAINDLPLDAVLAADVGGDFLNWQRLMALRRLTAIISKPLLAAVPPDVKPEELKILWDAGIDGVVVVAADEHSEQLQNLRAETEKLTPSMRKRGKAQAAVLPQVSGMAEPPPEPDEEEDYD